jgi:hypothetical protein
MELKNIVIGTGTGLAVNSLVQKAMNQTWVAIGQKYGAEAKLKFQELLKQGKTEQEAALIIEKNAPLWKKLGSNRVNGFIGLALGYGTFLASKNKTVKVAASGIMFSGALKVLFPTRMMDLEFFNE